MSEKSEMPYCPIARCECRENCAFVDEDGGCLVAEALCGIALLAESDFCLDVGGEVEQ